MIDSDGLSLRADVVLADLHSRQPARRPLFIEFAGTPKSGKSSCIDSVVHFFRRKRFVVLAPSEGASRRTPYYLREDLIAFNAWSACYALTQILEGLYHADRYDVVVLDRGLFDALVWFELLAGDGKIANSDREAVHAFLLLAKWRSVVDLVFMFQVNPDEALSREYKGKLIKSSGRVMNQQFLTRFNEACDAVQVSSSSLFNQFVGIDTSPETGNSQEEAAAQVVDAALGLCEAELETAAWPNRETWT